MKIFSLWGGASASSTFLGRSNRPASVFPDEVHEMTLKIARQNERTRAARIRIWPDGFVEGEGAARRHAGKFNHGVVPE